MRCVGLSASAELVLDIKLLNANPTIFSTLNIHLNNLMSGMRDLFN